MSDDDFVLLESADGYTFAVQRKIACASGVIKSMLDEEGMPYS
jgi:transcription elongation factor B subunit 1